MRKELKIGLICFVMSIVLSRFTSTHDFILGALTGLGICFIVVGRLPDKAYRALRSWKNKA